jgi:hypothetical protein
MSHADIDNLMARFAALPGAELGAGPEDEEASARMEGFLATVPGLVADDDYMHFLRTWSGAYVQDEQADHIIDLFGFSGVSSDMSEMLEPVQPGQERVVVAQCIYHHTDRQGQPRVAEYSFALATDPADLTVYAHLVTAERLSSPWRRWAAGFGAWLAGLVDRGGWLDYEADLASWISDPPGAPSGT